MKNIVLAFLLIVFMVFGCQENNTPKAPLFIEPGYHGSCDPEIVYNSNDKHWYIYYTNRKGNKENTWLATPIGVIRSTDLVNWEFMGYCKFDGQGGKKDAESTYWAPAIIEHEEKLHMFVTWKPDTIPDKGPWGGTPGKIIHYETPVSDPLNGWEKTGVMHHDTLGTIDATIYEENGLFHLWFKGKGKSQMKNELYHLVSTDMYNWEDHGFTKSDVFNKSVTGSGFEEAPYIFDWKGKKWLITDPHEGLFVYWSNDGENWNFQGTILKEPGTRPMDNSMGRHCSVAIVNDQAFIFYHVEPWRDYHSPVFEQPVENRRSVLQMAELEIKDEKLVCDRNKQFSVQVTK